MSAISKPFDRGHPPKMQKTVLRVAWVTEGIAFCGPVGSLFFEHIPNGARQSRFVYYLSLPYALIVWLMKGFAILYCVPLGIAVCGVVVCPNISPRTKAIVFVVGGFSYFLLVHWAGTIRSFG